MPKSSRKWTYQIYHPVSKANFFNWSNLTGVNSITSMAQKIGEDKNYLLTNALLFNFKTTTVVLRHPISKRVLWWNLIMTQKEGNMSGSWEHSRKLKHIQKVYLTFFWIVNFKNIIPTPKYGEHSYPTTQLPQNSKRKKSPWKPFLQILPPPLVAGPSPLVAHTTTTVILFNTFYDFSPPNCYPIAHSSNCPSSSSSSS